MATFENAASVIRQRFETVLGGVSPSVATFHDNVKGDPPDNDAWARLTIVWGEGFIAGIGDDRRYRYPGIAAIQIFLPAGDGTGRFARISDSITSGFRMVEVAPVSFKTPSLARAGLDPTGAWWQANVNIPFEFDGFDSD